MPQQGFNRVEILILLSIMIGLILVFLNFVFDVQRSARDSKRRADIETIAKQLELHFNRTSGQYCPEVGVDTYCYLQDKWFTKNKLPLDPLTSQPYFNLPKDGDKRFMICAKLEKENNLYGTKHNGDLGLAPGYYYCISSQQ
jgi:hypothetical protein